MMVEKKYLAIAIVAGILGILLISSIATVETTTYASLFDKILDAYKSKQTDEPTPAVEEQKELSFKDRLKNRFKLIFAPVEQEEDEYGEEIPLYEFNDCMNDCIANGFFILENDLVVPYENPTYAECEAYCNAYNTVPSCEQVYGSVCTQSMEIDNVCQKECMDCASGVNFIVYVSPSECEIE